MAARAKKVNRSKRVDSVRASRDGHQFHEAWVARRALGLLLPRFDLCAIAVEGLSEEDEQGVSDAVIEIADATFYYGKGASFESSTRLEVAQFKYSISKAATPLRIADLRKTLVKFAATEKDFVSKHGAETVARKITYSINTNRPFASETLEAFRAASTGQPAVSADANAQLSQLRSAVKQSDDGLRRFADRVLLVGLQIDDNDPSGVREALQRPRPASRIIRSFRLRPEKPWADSWIAPGKRVAFRSRAWGRQVGVGDRRDSDSGAALFATRPFLTDLLTGTDRDLLLLIKLQHFRDSERYNPADDDPSDRFTHSYSLLLVDRQLRVRPIVPTPADAATVAGLDKYSIHDFQKRLTALSKSRGE